MVRSEDFYLLMMESLLLKIRNLDDSQLSEAKALAYIFHNIPGVLRCNFDEDSAEEAFAVIRSRAHYFGLSDQIDEWEKRAFERLQSERLNEELVLQELSPG